MSSEREEKHDYRVSALKKIEVKYANADIAFSVSYAEIDIFKYINKICFIIKSIQVSKKIT